jgi:hypothetical protein
MFVNNVDVFDNTYKCNKKFGEYIITNFNIPVLSICDGCYIFSKTEELNLAIKKIPFIIKFMYGGVKS